ncbi:hypothetical protein RND71_012477 [Anisodus tanguticus]|uniref:Uncharacterized protein n=1 Tax=Anisodus tanguticus TaxID=243964 RepID=A0AAE1SEP8_9SOLA|nr:hypothetical protein RND71_012477 [Anisodus tanguticus]
MTWFQRNPSRCLLRCHLWKLCAVLGRLWFSCFAGIGKGINFPRPLPLNATRPPTTLARVPDWFYICSLRLILRLLVESFRVSIVDGSAA